MRCRVGCFSLLVCLALWGSGAGCGSKVTEASYYRVQYGMSEEAVEDILGPAHGMSVPPGQTEVKLKTWTRGALTIQVRFENGKVVGRTTDVAHEEVGRSAAESALRLPCRVVHKS